MKKYFESETTRSEAYYNRIGFGYALHCTTEQRFEFREHRTPLE
jgi:hypothetical protein